MPAVEIVSRIQEKAAQYASLQLDLLKELTSVDSGTGNIEGNKKTVEILKKALAPMGAAIECVEAPGVGIHLIARLGSAAPKRRIVLSAHIDTVFGPGEAAQHPFRIEGENAHGLGIVDCKGGVVVSMFAARIAHELGIIPPDLQITMLYNCDEEVGSQSSAPLFEKEGKSADYAFVFEPARGESGGVTSRKGCASWTVEVMGKEAHSGLAYDPKNDSCLELIRKLNTLCEKNSPEKGLFFSIGAIRAGRQAHSVPGAASAEVSVSFTTKKEMDWVQETIKDLEKKTGASNCLVHTTMTSCFPPMERTEGNIRAHAVVKKAADALGRHFPEQFSIGSSDACFLSSVGVPTVDALGPFMYGIHTVNEALKISTVQERTELFALAVALM